VIFGDPKGGTPLMLTAPSIALDLPIKLLIWEDDQGKVWLSYNSPEYLAERHGLPHNLLANIAFCGGAGCHGCRVIFTHQIAAMAQKR